LQQELTATRAAAPSHDGAAVIASRAPGLTDNHWIAVERWQRVKIGLSELAVVQILGAPTSLRNSPDGLQKTLFYTLEIGTSGFLSGYVRVAANRVTEVQTPIFRAASEPGAVLPQR
jgi:hypothetical protein